MTDENKNQTAVSRKKLAEILAVSVRQISVLEADRVIAAETRDRGRHGSSFILEEVVAKYLQYRLRQSEETPLDAKNRTQATLNQIRIDQQRGQLLPYDTVLAEGQQYVQRVQGRTRGPQLYPVSFEQASEAPQRGELHMAVAIRPEA